MGVCGPDNKQLTLVLRLTVCKQAWAIQSKSCKVRSAEAAQQGIVGQSTEVFTYKMIQNALAQGCRAMSKVVVN